MKTDLELLKEYLQSEIDCGNHKLFIFDENNYATELKTIDGFNVITDLEQEIERLNNIINELEKSIIFRLTEFKRNKDYFIDEKDIEQLYEELKELKESGNNEMD